MYCCVPPPTTHDLPPRYLTYGEEEWQEVTKRALDGIETYSEDARHSFEHTLGGLPAEGTPQGCTPLHLWILEFHLEYIL
jgi:hypothetical protein